MISGDLDDQPHALLEVFDPLAVGVTRPILVYDRCRGGLVPRLVWIDRFTQDIRFAWRQIARAPAFAITALLLTQAFTKVLLVVSSSDPLTFVVVAIVVSSTALVACYLPARRAARVNPVLALRHDWAASPARTAAWAQGCDREPAGKQQSGLPGKRDSRGYSARRAITGSTREARRAGM